MRKEELRRLKRINATPKMVQMAQNNQQEMLYRPPSKFWSPLKKNTVYDLMVRCQTRGPYLMVCIFLPKEVAKGNLTPAYEVYCNIEGNEYITRILINGREQKWSHAMVDNIGRLWSCIHDYRFYEGAEKRIWQNPEGMQTIQHVLKTKEKGIWGLLEWQRDTRQKNIEAAEAREQAPWDADMKLIPEIFPSFNGWMMKEATRQHYIFYEYDRNVTEGYCSHCRRIVPVTKPKHNSKGVCSHCGIPVQYKVSSKIRTLKTDEYKGQVIQKIKGGIVIRTFRQSQWYRDTDYRHPKSYLYETERIMVMDDGGVRRYIYGNYKNKKNRFILDKNYSVFEKTYYSSLIVKLYSRNLVSLKKTILKNSAIDLWQYLPVGTADYIVCERSHPVIEKLARVGMFRLAEQIMKNRSSLKLLDEKETELAKILRIDRGRLKRLRAIGAGGTEHLEWYQYEKRMDTVFPDAMIKDFGNSGFESASFNFLTQPLLGHTSFVKIWHYLQKQSALMDKPMISVKGTWEDYINMAEKAKMDVQNEMIWKPKDLYAAHQELVMILQQGEMEKEAKKLEKQWKKVNSQLPKLQKYEYTDGKFSIVAPKGIIDIVREGRVLQHCVHTCDFYFDRIERDESYLFFLRKAEHEDIPWYTLEVEPNGNIRQKRTTGDNQNKDFDEAVKFLKKWQKEFVRRMSEEEKQLGIKADQARIQGYAKLRKDGNRVWHGRLAGQLLADVLEDDFMAAVF